MLSAKKICPRRMVSDDDVVDTVNCLSEWRTLFCYQI